MEDVTAWTRETVTKWLQSHGCGSFVDTFQDEDIDGPALLALTDEELKQLVPRIGPRARIRALISSTKDEQSTRAQKGDPEQLQSEENKVPSHMENEDAESTRAQKGDSEQLQSQENKVPSQVENEAMEVEELPVPAQITVQRLISAAGTVEKMYDRYQPLRARGIKVYEGELLEKQPLFRKEYFKFRNEESLKLVQQGKPTKLIDGIVLLNWKLYGRREALLLINHKEIHYEVETADPFQKYDTQYLRKQQDILQLDKQIEESIQQKTERLRKGTLDTQGKKSLDQLIQMSKTRRENLLTELDVIAKNWDTAMKKWIRTGPPKKRGRKSKQAVVFKTAKQLKLENVVVVSADETEEDSENDGADNTKKSDVVIIENDAVDITKKSDVIIVNENDPVDSTEKTDEVDIENDAVDMTKESVDLAANENDAVNSSKKSDVNQNDLDNEIRPTEKLEFKDGIEGLRSTVSQHNCLGAHPDQGSSACMGIAVKSISDFFSDIASPSVVTEDVMTPFISRMKDVCKVWEEKHLGPTFFAEAVRELTIENLSVESEEWWRKSEKDLPSRFLESVYEIKGKKAVLVTFKPSHTIVVLLDGDNNELLLDSHVHFDKEETFEQALERGHGSVAIIGKRNILTNFILSKEFLDMARCGAEGDIMIIVPKN